MHVFTSALGYHMSNKCQTSVVWQTRKTFLQHMVNGESELSPTEIESGRMFEWWCE